MKNLFAVLLLCLVFSIRLDAQTDNPQQDSAIYLGIETTDGTFVIGEFVKEDDEYIWIDGSFGETKIKKTSIVSKQVIDKSRFKDGKYWFENPNATRNLYGPTGYGLNKGEGYYQNFMILLNSVSYGFTDNITVGVGIIPFSFGDGLAFTITPKVSFPIVEDQINVGAGVLYANLFGESAAIAYGVGTFGSKDNNFTFGLGYGNIDSEWADRPIVTLSGMLRTGRRISIVTENWFVPISSFDGFDYQGFLTGSARIMLRKVSLDIGVIGLPGEGVAFPVVGIVLPFGNYDTGQRIK